MIIRAILPDWAKELDPSKKKVIEADLNGEEIDSLNREFYNIYFLPNTPNMYDSGITVNGSHIDQFNCVFVDMDLKEGKWESKEQFINELKNTPLAPSIVVDSGNGIHAYWNVSDLDGLSFLRLQRRLCRAFTTDEAVSKIYQLMRLPDTINTKKQDDLRLCEIVLANDNQYTCEELDKLLPPITPEDEQYCVEHYNKTYDLNQKEIEVDDIIPIKFSKLIRDNKEVKDIWSGNTDDRSISDFRLGHIMFASGFTKDEALSVLVNSGKALQRLPKHRISYASNIVDKIWIYELTQDKDTLNLSSTVRQILDRHGDAIKGTKFPCFNHFDDTIHGFRLGQVIGLVAGSGVGKTAMALNMFMGFVQNNPDYDHFFIPLEQPDNEIADRWKTLCGDQTQLHDKVHVISNYAENGEFRHLSLDDIKQYLLKFQEKTKRKIGCVVIDHIGALKKKDANSQFQGIEDICHHMKGFAIETNTLLIMQSQTNREKAGIGDLELNKDAAFGTVFFESYCDFLLTLWQPLKRCHMEESCPTTTAYKYCKIRHKSKGDNIQEDVCYKLFFDPNTGKLREMTQDEDKSFDFFNNKCNNKRKLDRKDGVSEYKSVRTG